MPDKTFQLSLHVRPDLLKNFDRDKHSSLFDLFACDKEKCVIEWTQVIKVIKLFFFVTDAAVK